VGALALRSAAAAALAAGQWPEGAPGALLDSLHREVWVVLPDDSAHLAGPEERVVARAANTRLVRMERQPR
jgi:hypothetical protein